MEKEARRKEKFKENQKIEEKEQKESWSGLEKFCASFQETEPVNSKTRKMNVYQLKSNKSPALYALQAATRLS
jgi:hypothetical protein